MSPFAYLSVLTSIVLALGITRILSGYGQLVQVRHEVRVYWVHAFWGINVLLYLLMNWWILYRWQVETKWTFFLFVFVLLSPVIGYLLAALLFPEHIDIGADLKEQYYSNSRLFFLLAALLSPIDLIDTSLKGVSHLLAQGPIYFVTIFLLFTLNLVAASTKRESYHKFFVVFFFIYILLFIGINLRVLA